jgi:predicted amidohydrolase
VGRVIHVAGVQSNPTILAKETNLAGCLASVRTAAQDGADLIVFPECALTGYCFSSLDEALTVAEPVPGPSVNAVAALCAELGVYVVLGLLERADDKCFNAVALVGPEGFVGKYRKLHLPYLGVDRFATQGDLALRSLTPRWVSWG